MNPLDIIENPQLAQNEPRPASPFDAIENPVASLLQESVQKKRPWNAVELDLQNSGVDSSQAKDYYRLDLARERVKGQPERWLPGIDESGRVVRGRIAERAIPFISAGVQAGESIKLKRAQDRIARGEGDDDDFLLVAGKERLEQIQQQRSTGEKFGNELLAMPAMLGEAVMSPVTGVNQLPRIYQGLRAGGTRAGLLEAGKGAATLAARTATIPSVYLPRAAERARVNGGSVLSPENIGPAFAYGMLQVGIMGEAVRIGRMAPGGLGGRTAAGGLAGYTEQQIGDAFVGVMDQVLPDALQLKTGYGSFAEIIGGNRGDGIAQAGAEMVMFAAAAALLGRAPKPVVENFGRMTDWLAEKYKHNPDIAGKAASMIHRRINLAQQQYPGMRREQAVGLFRDMPEPMQEYARIVIDQTFPALGSDAIKTAQERIARAIQSRQKALPPRAESPQDALRTDSPEVPVAEPVAEIRPEDASAVDRTTAPDPTPKSEAEATIEEAVGRPSEPGSRVPTVDEVRGLVDELNKVDSELLAEVNRTPEARRERVRDAEAQRQLQARVAQAQRVRQLMGRGPNVQSPAAKAIRDRIEAARQRSTNRQALPVDRGFRSEEMETGEPPEYLGGRQRGGGQRAQTLADVPVEQRPAVSLLMRAQAQAEQLRMSQGELEALREEAERLGIDTSEAEGADYRARSRTRPLGTGPRMSAEEQAAFQARRAKYMEEGRARREMFQRMERQRIASETRERFASPPDPVDAQVVLSRSSLADSERTTRLRKSLLPNATDADIARLANAIDGAEVSIKAEGSARKPSGDEGDELRLLGDASGERLSLSVSGHGMRSWRSITREGDDLILNNAAFFLQWVEDPTVTEGRFPGWRKENPNADGIEMLAQQVRAARKLGIFEIRTEGSREVDLGQTIRGPADRMWGYYAWPRAGYDGNIPWESYQKLPDNLRQQVDDNGVASPYERSILALMATEEGRNWWEANGETIDLTFDPHPSSLSSRTLEAYLVERAERAYERQRQANRATPPRVPENLGDRPGEGTGEAQGPAAKVPEGETTTDRPRGRARGRGPEVKTDPVQLADPTAILGEIQSVTADASPAVQRYLTKAARNIQGRPKDLKSAVEELAETAISAAKSGDTESQKALESILRKVEGVSEIGKAGDQVEFDPGLHTSDVFIETGQATRVSQSGWQYGSRVLSKATVSQQQASRRGGRARGRGPEAKRPADPSPLDVYTVPVKDLNVDPQRFQYKVSGIDESGVTSEMRSVRTWNPKLGGVLLVWRDPANGKDYVVNGHHRFELANRLGTKSVNVRYIKAKSATKARAIGALANIAEGRGTAIDAAKYLRDTNSTPQELQESGVSLVGRVANDAIALADLDDGLFQRVAEGRLDEAQAISVAKHLKDKELQKQLFNRIAQREERGKEWTKSELEQAAKKMANAGTVKTSEENLFGKFEDEKSTFDQEVEIESYVARKLATEVGDFRAGSSARRAGRLSEAGNVLNVEENQRLRDQAQANLEIFNQLVHRSGPISQAVKASAAELAQAKTQAERNAIKDRAVESIQEAIRQELGKTDPTLFAPRRFRPGKPTNPSNLPGAVNRTADPISPFGIIETMKQMFGLSVYLGRVTANASAAYLRHLRQLAMSGMKAGDLDTNFHELAHHIEVENGLDSLLDPKTLPRDVQVGFAQFDYDPGNHRPKTQMEEGFAEYIRLRQLSQLGGLTREQTAAAAWAENALKNAGLTGKLDRLRDLVSQMAQQTPLEQFSGLFSKDGKPISAVGLTLEEQAVRSLEGISKEFEYVWLERLEAAKRLEREADRIVGRGPRKVSKAQEMTRLIHARHPWFNDSQWSKGIATYVRRAGQWFEERLTPKFTAIFEGVNESHLGVNGRAHLGVMARSIIGTQMEGTKMMVRGDQMKQNPDTRAEGDRLAKQGAKMVGMVPPEFVAKAKQALAEIQRDHPDLYQQLPGIHQKWLNWHNSYLRGLESVGTLERGAVDRMIESNPYYMPMGRAMENSFSAMFSGDRGGSGRAIVDPMIQTLARGELYAQRVTRQMTDNVIYEAMNVDPTTGLRGVGDLIKEVPVEPGRLTGGEDVVRQNLEQLGLTEAEIDQIIGNFGAESLEFFVKEQAPWNPGGPNFYRMMYEGKPHRFHVKDKNLYLLLTGQLGSDIRGSQVIRGFGPIMKHLTNTIKTGATGAQMVFPIKSTVMGMAEYMINAQTKGVGKRLANMATGMVRTFQGKYQKMFGKAYSDPFYRIFEESIGEDLRAMGFPIRGYGRAEVRKAMGKKTDYKEVGVKAINTTKDLLETWSGGFELGPRFGEFAQALKEKGYTRAQVEAAMKAEPGRSPIPLEDLVEPMVRAGKSMIWFQRQGALTHDLNQVIPFFGAHVAALYQEADNLSQAFRAAAKGRLSDDKLMRVAGVMATAFTLEVLNWWHNKDKEWYKNLSDHQRYNWWVMGQDESGKVWGIPKPHGVLRMSTATIQELLRAESNSLPEASALTGLFAAETIGRPIPPAVSITGEVLANTGWSGRDIVPRREQPSFNDFDQWMEYRMPYILDQATGGLVSSRIDRGPQHAFIAGGQDPSKPIELYYEEMDRLERMDRKLQYNRQMLPPNEQMKLARLRQVKGQMDKISQAIRGTQMEGGRLRKGMRPEGNQLRELRQMQIDLAKMGLGLK